MIMELLRKIDNGAYADLYEGRDDLDRAIAVKIIYPSAGGSDFIISQAKALARAQHKNIVTVYSVEEVINPENKKSTKAIIMEYLPGQTLFQLLEGPKISVDEAKRIEEGILEGLEHLHHRGLIHSDLHADNIIITDNDVKLIDILYDKTLKNNSAATIKAKIQSDLNSAKILLRDILDHSSVDAGNVSDFSSSLNKSSTITDIKNAFQCALKHRNEEKHLEQVYKRVVDPHFVEGLLYARALSRATETYIIRKLLENMIDSNATRNIHYHYLSLLWARITEEDKRVIVNILAIEIDNQTPKGHWSPHLIMLHVFGIVGWKLLPDLTRIRLEGLITEDLLSGRYDIYGTALSNTGGALGTWLTCFWPYFTDLQQAVSNIISLLTQSWYTQNYIGNYFLTILPVLADKTGKKDEVIKAIAIAYSNDAKMIKNNLKQLPTDWAEFIEF